MPVLPIQKLKNWEKNPRTVKTYDFERLLEQIKRLGRYKPLLITDENIVIGGNTRLKALNELVKQGHDQYKEVECNLLTFTKVKGGFNVSINGVLVQHEGEATLFDTKEQAMIEYALSDNDQVGAYEMEALAELGLSENLPKGMYGVGVREQATLEEVLDAFGPSKEDEPPDPDKSAPAKSKKGKIYELGNHLVYCGDAKDSKAWAEMLDGELAQLVFTSPPYNMAGGLYDHYQDDMESSEYVDLNLEVAQLARDYSKGFVFWNISYNKNSRSEHIEIIYRMEKELGLRFLEHIIWDKGHALPVTSTKGLTRQFESVYAFGDADDTGHEPQDIEHFLIASNNRQFYFNKKTNRAISNYWRIPTSGSQHESNAACFPVALPHRAIKLMTEEDGIVFDPFGGSGTTLIAAEQAGRRCRMIELDPHYVDVIRKRYAKFIGKEDEWQTLTPERKLKPQSTT